MERCSRCVTPDTYFHTKLDKDGVCNYCNDHAVMFTKWKDDKPKREKELNKLLAWAKKAAKKNNSPYDVVVPLSGGKDSTYALYLATKVFGLRVLCVNFDNGFQSDIAKRNIQNAIKASGADLYVEAPNKEKLYRLYKHFLKHTGMFCPVCLRGITMTVCNAATVYRVPLIFQGTAKRTEETVVPEMFLEGSVSLFSKVLKKHPFGEHVDNLYQCILPHSKDIKIADYVDWDLRTVVQTVKDEYGWEEDPERYTHFDCFADPVVHYLRKSRSKDLTENTLNYSAEIRVGLMTREDALKRVEEEEKHEQEVGACDPEHIDYLCKKLDMTREELASYVEVDNQRHMKYL